MPIYEYWCRQCAAGFDKLQPMGSASDEAKCPRCGAPAKKMLSLVAAVNRGSSSSETGPQYGASSGGGCACGGHCGCGGHH